MLNFANRCYYGLSINDVTYLSLAKIITFALNERCQVISQSVSLVYFVKVLCPQDPIKANKLHSQSFLLT